MIASAEIIVPQAGQGISDSPPDTGSAATVGFAVGFATWTGTAAAAGFEATG